MKTVVLFPTIEEGKAFILGEPPVSVFISGVGCAETASAVVRAVKAKKPDVVILAGIAGAYDRAIPIGSVVEVCSEQTASLPEKYIHTYTVEPSTDLPAVRSNTVDSVGVKPGEAQIENMEGAALIAVCEALGVACCEIRAVSNYVGDPFQTWEIDRAVENLTEILNQYFHTDEKEQ